MINTFENDQTLT